LKISKGLVFVTPIIKQQIMKVIGIILILLGIGIIVFQGIRSAEKEKSLDIGPIEISKQVQRSNNRQLYVAGGAAIIAGLILTLAGRKKIAAR